MKILFISPKGFLSALVSELEALGHQVVSDNPDIILCMSVSQMDKLNYFTKKYPSIPVINYNWDIYEWVWDNPRPDEYDFKKYVDILRASKEVWVPSNAEMERSKNLGLTNVRVIKTFVPYWEYDSIKDGRYVLNPLREIPDKYWGMFEMACEDLGIPYKTTGHSASFDDYKKIVAECSFIVSPLRELSTGGLTLVEGGYLGKPCLVYGGATSAAKEYAPWAETFMDLNELKIKLRLLWEKTPIINESDWIKKHYSVEIMAKQIHERLCELTIKTVS